jgi:hypothetical protein
MIDNEEDDLDVFRGIVHGFFISIVLWALI